MDKLRSWILTITTRECNDFIRRKYRDRELHGGDFSAVRKDQIDTLTVYASLERQETLRLAMERLSEQCRQLLRMLFLEDEQSTYVEAAERLGISKDSIGSARQRCLDRLRKLLEKDTL
jgi:RNA polymerase sigma factor (sigma-70 family)